ncbi:MAG TPA: LemA family protein [Candidatus Didemnitutus sp.]|nr:LemA family protein [Candidatus Didemnitutus sp.]
MLAAIDSEKLYPWLPLGSGLAAVGFLWGAFRAAGKQRLIDGLPTCKTTGVFIGLVEVKGTAEATEPLTSFLAGTSCVDYSWSVDEQWSRTVTETTTDSKGNTTTRTRTETGWATVAQGGEQIAFYVKDDCGVLQVQPAGAKIEPKMMFDETCGRGDALYYAKGPATSIANSDHRRRFVERAVPLHADVYVVGQARERQDVVAAEIAADREAPLFLISTRTEAQVSRGYAATFWVLVILGLAAAAGGIGYGLQRLVSDPGRQWMPYALGGASYVLLFFGGWTWMVYNSLVDLRNRVASAWSQVEVQLKRRFDLIPRLEGVVQGLAQHERSVQEGLAALRAQRTATPPGEAGPDIQALGGSLTAIAERYPELKANDSFLRLQRELSDTEQRVALARGYYNEIATHYNTTIEIVPERFVAGFTGLKSRSLLEAGDFERAPVQVKLAS